MKKKVYLMKVLGDTISILSTFYTTRYTVFTLRECERGLGGGWFLTQYLSGSWHKCEVNFVVSSITM
jgi:hypothetical protein